MRLVSALFSVSLVAMAFADAKTDCIKALDEAKKAGLPISPADLKVAKPSKQTLALEKLIDKADKAMRKYDQNLSDQVTMDMENLRRKKQGKPEIPYPVVTPAQKAAGTKQTLAIIEQIGATTAPRQVNVRSTPLFSFPRSSIVKSLVNIELESVTSSSAKGEAKQVLQKLRVVRRLLALIRSDDTMVGVLMQQASEQKYYAALQKIAKEHLSISKSFSTEFVAPFRKPSVDQILREEFLHTLSTFERSSEAAKKHPTVEVGGWKLDGGKESLQYLTAITKAWTTSFTELKSCKSGKELEERYKILAPKLGTLKVKDQDPMLLGPSWADGARALDKAEAKRQETIKVLGLG